MLRSEKCRMFQLATKCLRFFLFAPYINAFFKNKSNSNERSLVKYPKSDQSNIARQNQKSDQSSANQYSI